MCAAAAARVAGERCRCNARFRTVCLVTTQPNMLTQPMAKQGFERWQRPRADAEAGVMRKRGVDPGWEPGEGAALEGPGPNL